tara:strand:+ start:5838 stop:6023 length:186 start_codon:yes stop_codon:yes gene_type:complete
MLLYKAVVGGTSYKETTMNLFVGIAIAFSPLIVCLYWRHSWHRRQKIKAWEKRYSDLSSLS